MFLLILMNLIVISCSFLLARSFFVFNTLSDYLMGWFVLYVAQIIFTLQLLGVFNLLYLPQVLALNGLLLIFAILLTNLRPKKRAALGYSFFFDEIGRFFVLNKIEWLCFCTILGFVLVKLVVNLINPPFGWDSLNYHFTFPVEWLKHGNLDNPISISGDPSVSYYPVNGSLFFLWFILPLKNVFIADLGQFPFFLAAFFAVFAIAKKIGLDKEYAFFSAAIFSLMPNYFKQLRIAYIDIIVASLFLLTVNFILSANRERSLAKLFLASVSLGLMLGTKTTAMPLALLLLVPLLWVGIFSFKRKIIYAFCLIFASIILFGGFSFIRNYLQTGNPLYPLNFQVFNFTLFKGVIDNTVYRTGIRPGDFSLTKLLFSEGLGAQTLLLILPASLFAPLLILRQRKNLDFLFGYLLILPILLVLVFRFILPLPNIRYVYALFAIGSIIAFYGFSILKVPKGLARSLVFICVIASLAENGKRMELVWSFILTVLLFVFAVFLLKRINKRILKMVLAVFLVLLIPGLILLQKDYVANEYSRYTKTTKLSGYWPEATQAWLWFNNHTDKNNVAYIGRPVQFPLYGTNFKNNVYYVSVNKVEPAMLHYYPNSKYICGYNDNQVFRNFESPENYRGNADYNVWLGNLKKKGTEFLFVYSELMKKTDDFPLEDKWAIAHPEIFNLVFKNNTIHIYRISNA